MYPVKQSTALTVPFFVHDASGDAVTGLTDGSFTKRISKNGAAFGAMTVTISELENGWYSIPFSASHSDTLGLVSVTFTNAGAKQVNLQFRVHARLPDDLTYPTTTGRSLDITAGGTAGIDWGNVENQGTTVDLSDTATNLVDTTTTNTDMAGTDNALLAASAPTNFGDLSIQITTGFVSLLAATQASIDAIEADTNELQGDWTNGGRLDLILDAAALEATVAALNDISTAQVNAEVVDVLKTDTTTLPGQTAPPLAPTFEQMISWLYKVMRNRKTQTATQWSLLADDESTVDAKAPVSDDGTTATKQEIVTGP